MKKYIVLTALCLQFVCMHQLQASNREEVSKVLDQLHFYASKANSKQYFSLFSDNAVYIGTDASETWTIEQFKTFAEPYFNKGKGWTYISNNRHIYFSKSKKTAWFDEMLLNENYGETRGTGILTKSHNGWKIEQYHLTLPIPNELAKQVVKMIKDNKINKEL